MSIVPSFHAAQALSAYRNVDGGLASSAATRGDLASPAAIGGDLGGGTGDFASLLKNSLGTVIDTGRTAESQAMGAINGGGDLTHVVTAVSRAELALQTTVAVRDRVLQAYQDIIKMSI